MVFEGNLTLIYKHFDAQIEAYSMICDAIFYLNGQSLILLYGAEQFEKQIKLSELFDEPSVKQIEIMMKRLDQNIKPPSSRLKVIYPKSMMAWCDLTIIREEGHILLLLKDITKKQQELINLREIARRDPLTGAFYRCWQKSLIRGKDKEDCLPLWFAFFDVSGMGLINNAFGYQEGDRLLARCSAIIKSASPLRGELIRTGSDEFMLIVPNCNDSEQDYILSAILESCEQESIAMIPPHITIACGVKSSMERDVYSVIREVEQQLRAKHDVESKVYGRGLIKKLRDHLSNKNFESMKHIIRVKGLSLMLGDALGLNEEQRHCLTLAAELHDIGKVAIPESILGKNSPPDEDEWVLIKRHPETGYRIANSMVEYAEAADIILSHHERWDGGGYPRGLKGDKIPILARILSIVDAYDNMVHNPYRASKTYAQAQEEIKTCAGGQFDPEIAALFLRILSLKS